MNERERLTGLDRCYRIRAKLGSLSHQARCKVLHEVMEHQATTEIRQIANRLEVIPEVGYLTSMEILMAVGILLVEAEMDIDDGPDRDDL
jgi:hypothetical protein